MTKKGNRVLIGLVCPECKLRGYTSVKNTTNTKDKISLSKFCKQCRKHTLHTETAKLD